MLQNAFEAELDRHLVTEKELTLCLEQYKNKLNYCENDLANCTEKLKNMICIENHKEIVQNNEAQIANLKEKLESSYCEVGIDFWIIDNINSWFRFLDYKIP